MRSTRRPALIAVTAVMFLIAAAVLSIMPPSPLTLGLIFAAALVGVLLLIAAIIPRLTALLSAERRLARYHQQLDHAARELQSVYDKQIEQDLLRSEFLASISHELRTPLTLLVGPIDYLLASNTLTMDQKTILQLAKRNARALQQHVDDLLVVSNLQMGQAALNYVRVDLVPLVRLTASYFELVAHQSKLTFTIDTPKSLTAEVDQNKFKQIALNLLANAFKYAPDGGIVRCRLSTEGDQAVLLVQDNGADAKPGVRPGVFLRVPRRSGDDTSPSGSSNLGLTIAAEFIFLHGGKISVSPSPEAAPNHGPLFRVELPLKAPDGIEIGMAQSEPFDKSVAENLLENLRPGSVNRMDTIKDANRAMVLVVEDNPEMNRFISVTLSSLYRVASAYNGQEGLERALALHPDLIISDLMMPEMDGTEMVRAIRTRPSLDGVPIVLLTASPDDDIRIQLLQEGAQDYLIKPFSVEELRVRVGNLIAQKRAHDMLQRELATQGEDAAVLATELTRRKRELDAALNDLRLSQLRFRRLSEANIIGILTGHLSGSIDEVNQAFLDMVGYTREALIGGKMSWVEITPTEHAESDAEAVAELRSTGVANPWEKEYIRKDGSRIPVLLGAVMVDDSADTFICFIVDLTDRKRTEEHQRFLAEASDVLSSSLDYRETLHSLVNFIVPRFADWCSVYIIDEDGDLQLVDATIRDPQKKVLLDDFTERNPVRLNDSTDVVQVLRTGQPHLVSDLSPEYIAQNVDPERQTLLGQIGTRSRMVVPLVARGHVFGVMTFNSVESARRYMQPDLLLAQDLGRRAGLAVDNARLYRDSQQAIRTRDEFLSVAAHELKTPVTSLRGFSQLTMRYLDRNVDEAALDMGRIRHALESIDQQADKLARLIQQLLGITRIQSGRLVLERESMDLMTLVKNVADSGQARTTRHTITVDGPPNLLINADQLRLEQVLTNLVDNAIKYSPDGGPISIHLMAEPDDFAIISVSDRGLGIEPEHRDKIFDLFYQAHGQSKLGGMGLGLYISREIVELHGGSMGAEFPAEGGTCFVVRLPIAMQNVPTPEASGHEA